MVLSNLPTKQSYCCARTGHLCFCVAESWKFPRTETPQSHKDPILVLHNTLRYFFFWCPVCVSQAVICDSCSICHCWVSHSSVPHPAWGAHRGWPHHPVQGWDNNNNNPPLSPGPVQFVISQHEHTMSSYLTPISWDSQVISNKCVHPPVK